MLYESPTLICSGLAVRDVQTSGIYKNPIAPDSQCGGQAYCPGEVDE